MDILKIKHIDFTITVITKDLLSSFLKAKERCKNILTETSYRVSQQVEQLAIWNPGNEELKDFLAGEEIHPIFFENKSYIIDIEFHASITNPVIHTKDSEIRHDLLVRKVKDTETILGTCTLNFGNNLGFSDLCIKYRSGNVQKQFTFTFEVFPVKLDLKQDYQEMIRNIEHAYPLLVLDFLRCTYSHFKETPGSSAKIIWWAIFGNIFNEILKDIKLIIALPHSKLVSGDVFMRRESIKNAGCLLEEELYKYRNIPGRYFKVVRKELIHDTYENRFVKFALLDVKRRFNTIYIYIKKKHKNQLTADFKSEFDMVEKQLQNLTNHPFFTEIGDFNGLKQESVILHQRSGYSGLLKNWLMLRKGYKLFEGIQKIELKNIAELYKIWCFLEVKKMLEELTQSAPEAMELAGIDDTGIVTKLRQHAKSKVVFNNNGYVIELYHELEYKTKFDDDYNGSYTIDQKPDIVLKIKKPDLIDDLTLTYLFDAKYRLRSEEKDGEPDLPPNDAINQMHRYRDAIYYENKQTDTIAKEVIGGYVLYPGRGKPEDFKSGVYINSIKKVNIGAFPLLPGNRLNDTLLKDHLASLIAADSERILKDIFPQKGKKYEPDNGGVFIAIVTKQPQIEHLLHNNRPLFHFYKSPELLSAGGIRYFAPYIEGKGICCYFEIENCQLKARKDVFPQGHLLYSENSKRCWVFSLKNRKHLGGYYKLTDGIRTIKYTDLKNLRNPRHGKIQTIKSASMPK